MSHQVQSTINGVEPSIENLNIVFSNTNCFARPGSNNNSIVLCGDQVNVRKAYDLLKPTAAPAPAPEPESE